MGKRKDDGYKIEGERWNCSYAGLLTVLFDGIYVSELRFFFDNRFCSGVFIKIS